MMNEQCSSVIRMEVTLPSSEAKTVLSLRRRPNGLWPMSVSPGWRGCGRCGLRYWTKPREFWYVVGFFSSLPDLRLDSMAPKSPYLLTHSCETAMRDCRRGYAFDLERITRRRPRELARAYGYLRSQNRHERFLNNVQAARPNHDPEYFCTGDKSRRNSIKNPNF